MMKNKVCALILVFVMVSILVAGCTTGPGYKDGHYFVQEDEFSAKTGWKSTVTFDVENGKIANVDWNAVNVKAGLDKKTASKEGKYPMVEVGGAQAHWHEQAEKAEAYLLEKQDPKAIEYSDEEGHTDAISGVSVHVSDFFLLVDKALTNGPVERGPYTDGAYHAEEPEFSEQGWKYTVDITVMNGEIVSAYWNGIHNEQEKDKKTTSIDGEYGMVEKGGAQAEWHEQAMKAEAHLIKTQDPTDVTYSDDEGHTDAISGVTIHVIEFFNLVEEALSGAK
jgi:major membrane immunogen (membrane-anchored lipoprotein)